MANLEALKRAHDTLSEILTAENFEMEYWGEVLALTESECGFAGCLAGHLAHIKFQPNLSRDESMSLVKDWGDDFAPSFRGRMGFDGLCIAFGIDDAQADFLFDPNQYEGRHPSPQEALNRLWKASQGDWDGINDAVNERG